VVTARISDLVIRLTTRPTFSPATQAVIDRYAPRDGERERCLRELSLVVANAVLMPALVLVAGLLGWLTAAEVGSRPVLVVYAWAAATLLSGVIIHLARYLDAWIGWKLTRERRDLSWPRGSSDVDLFLQVGTGVVIAIAVAYQ
jgi:heme A synthase